MPQNVLTVKVNDKTKTLRFSETLVAGSVYSITVEGGADICGSQAVLGLKIGNTTVGWAELADGEGTLSLLTQELADALADVREGTRVPALAAIRCMDEGADQVIGVGKADVLYAGKGWMETTALVQITAKGDKGDTGKSAYQTAVENGFDGSEEEWAAYLIAGATAAEKAARATANAAEATEKANTSAEKATAAAKAASDALNEFNKNVGSFIGDSILAARYPLVAKTLDSTNAATLDAFSVNTLTIASGVTRCALAMPAAVAGKSRDFLLVLTTPDTASLTVDLTGGTFYGQSSDTWEVNESVSIPNVFAFTEIAENVFAVSRRTFGASQTYIGVAS